jgi:hypothetical protein
MEFNAFSKSKSNRFQIIGDRKAFSQTRDRITFAVRVKQGFYDMLGR